jgi:hypothetical protein
LEGNLQSDHRNRDGDGYESENSEKIKELFNKMLTNQEEQYDIRNDEPYNQINDQNKEELRQSKFRQSIKLVQRQSQS